MLKAYEFRIFPTKEQEQFLLKTNGLCRLYWNTTLARKKEAWEKGEWKIQGFDNNYHFVVKWSYIPN